MWPMPATRSLLAGHTHTGRFHMPAFMAPAVIAPMSATIWRTHDPMEENDAAYELACGCMPGRAHGTMCADKVTALPTVAAVNAQAA